MHLLEVVSGTLPACLSSSLRLGVVDGRLLYPWGAPVLRAAN